MAIINFPVMYIPDPTRGRPLYNGQILVGEPDLDPAVPANQKQLRVMQEDGTLVNVTQPFLLSAGGVPVYAGSYVRLDVDGAFSLKILDNTGSQVYYVENAYEGTPILVEDLPDFVAAEFADVANMKTGTALNFANTVDFNDYLGREVTTVVNNSTSGKGGARYKIVNVDPSNLSTLVGGVWVGANHDLGGGFYAELVGGECYASQFGFTGTGDETTAFKRFFAFSGILRKIQDISFSVSGMCNVADNTTMWSSNGATISVIGDVTTDPDKGGANQGQCIELGHDCVLTGIKLIGNGNRGAGFLNQQKHNSTLQLCEADDNTWQAVHDFGGVGSRYLHCTFSRSLHGVQMWLSQDVEVVGCHVYQVYGGIWTAAAQNVRVYGNDVHDCEDVGIDWEGGNQCYAWGNKLRACNRGSLTVFGTGPELVGEGIVMGNLGFTANEIVHQGTFLNRTGVVTDNDLNDTAAMMLYFIDDTLNGPVYWNNNTVNVTDSTATNAGSLRAMTNRADLSDFDEWVSFENNTIYTKFRSAFRFQELRRLRVCDNEIIFQNVTQTSFDEIKNQHYGQFCNNTVRFDGGTPFSPTWKITNDKAMDGNMLIDQNEFFDGADTALDIDQSVSKRVTLRKNKLAPNRGSSTGGLTITSGNAQPIDQELVYKVDAGGSLDLSTKTGFYKLRGAGQGLAMAFAGGTNGAIYRIMTQVADIAGNCELADLEAAGGQFPDAARNISISGTTITPTGAASPNALVRITMSERTAA